jgi:hypothetical protein
VAKLWKVSLNRRPFQCLSRGEMQARLREVPIPTHNSTLLPNTSFRSVATLNFVFWLKFSICFLKFQAQGDPHPTPHTIPPPHNSTLLPKRSFISVSTFNFNTLNGLRSLNLHTSNNLGYVSHQTTNHS